jgi:NhaC family Na+:H+ antiporter
VVQQHVAKKWGLILAAIFIISVFTCLYIGRSLVWGLTLTLALAIGILKSNGIPLKTSTSWILEGILSIKDIYVIVFLIGINVAMWLSSGIVPALIYYGFEIVDKVYFLLFAYLMTAVVAFFLGTGLGTLSTVGVALFSLGISIGMPSGILVGALMSGAYVADRLSPISALVNFTLETVNVPFRQYFKQTGIIMIPAAVLAGLAYYVLSLKYTSTISIEEMTYYKSTILKNFQISPFYFIVPVVVLWTSFRGLKSMKVLGIGITMSALITLLIQGQTPIDVIKFMGFGYASGSSEPFIKSLEIGGAYAMLEVVFIIMAGISMSTLYEKCGWIAPIISLVEDKSRNRVSALINTGVLSTVLDALTCDQTVGILVPGKYLKAFFNKHGFEPLNLAQIIANTGTAMAPLMPWNVNAIIVLAITGVSALEYAPYTFLNWFSFPIAIAMTHLVISRQKS